MKKKHQERIVRVRCVECCRETTHHVIRDYDKPIGNDDYFRSTEYTIIECAGCGAVSFMEETVSDDDYDPRTGEFVPVTTLFPHRDEETLPARFFEHVPEKLRRIYDEVISTFNSRNRTLCAAGLRALVEGICADRRVKTGGVWNRKTGKLERRKDLEGKINGLVQARVLTKRHATVLHQHRFLGNTALHELDAPTSDSLAAAINVLEHTLENVYELAHTAKRMRHKK